MEVHVTTKKSGYQEVLHYATWIGAVESGWALLV